MSIHLRHHKNVPILAFEAESGIGGAYGFVNELVLGTQHSLLSLDGRISRFFRISIASHHSLSQKNMKISYLWPFLPPCSSHCLASSEFVSSLSLYRANSIWTSSKSFQIRTRGLRESKISSRRKKDLPSGRSEGLSKRRTLGRPSRYFRVVEHFSRCQKRIYVSMVSPKEMTAVLRPQQRVFNGPTARSHGVIQSAALRLLKCSDVMKL